MIRFLEVLAITVTTVVVTAVSVEIFRAYRQWSAFTQRICEVGILTALSELMG